MGDVNFSGGWDTFWGAISAELGGVMTALTVIGTLLVVCSVLSWIWQKRRGGNAAQGLGGVFIFIFIGAVLAAPGLLIPGILSIIDWIANAIAALISDVSS